ncbi:MAG TPA: iron-sulfur cluster repair di-iron protein [Candidatus Acidoferrum sp.]|jgi:regulator of cell morphogenesis and NO signaling|nr:iron-sulfur cluster repair di-iron protein [Candidatus Acidoferrum sp.]
MSLMTAKTVREVALEHPGATRIFEKLGIDYCCGGNRSLEEACQKVNIPAFLVIDSLELAEAAEQAARTARNWQMEPLSELIAHIERVHHGYVREETVRLTALLEKVCLAHGKNHAELFEIRRLFAGLAQELTMHMMKEERILFPYIVRMEEAVIQKEPILPGPFGTVGNPVAMMQHEHDSAGQALRAMRKASADYVAPADACVSYKTLYKALEGFEADLHQHIHLENNILFPRAIAMEKGV